MKLKMNPCVGGQGDRGLAGNVQLSIANRQIRPGLIRGFVVIASFDDDVAAVGDFQVKAAVGGAVGIIAAIDQVRILALGQTCCVLNLQ